MSDSTARQWFEDKFNERYHELLRWFGDTANPGEVVELRNVRPAIPGACALQFPPGEADGDVLAREHWLTMTLGPSQPGDSECIGKYGVPGTGYELAMLTREHVRWPMPILQDTLQYILERDSSPLGPEHRIGILADAIAPDSPLTIAILYPYAVKPTFVTSTGAARILAATAIEEEEYDVARATSSVHVLLALAEVGIGQCTVPGRPSVARQAQALADMPYDEARRRLESALHGSPG